MTSAEQPLVLVVDDDPAVRTAIGSLVAAVGFQVETFGSAREFLSRPRPEAPACAILEVRLPGLSGLDLQRELNKMGNPIPIVFITGHGDVPTSVRAMKAGAVDFLTKPFRDQQLLDAIRVAIDRDRAQHRRSAEVAGLRQRYESLTSREREVMVRVTAGLRNNQIAAEMHASEITVKVRRGRVMRKMGADSLADLVKIAERLASMTP